jgi:hypothetical protein
MKNILVCLAFLSATFVVHADPALTEDAQAAAMDWLVLVDGVEYEESWSPWMRILYGGSSATILSEPQRLTWMKTSVDGADMEFYKPLRCSGAR